jgi:hypothetical protein
LECGNSSLCLLASMGIASGGNRDGFNVVNAVADGSGLNERADR